MSLALISYQFSSGRDSFAAAFRLLEFAGISARAEKIPLMYDAAFDANKELPSPLRYAAALDANKEFPSPQGRG